MNLFLEFLTKAKRAAGGVKSVFYQKMLIFCFLDVSSDEHKLISNLRKKHEFEICYNNIIIDTQKCNFNVILICNYNVILNV